jgi:hypothetical protein
MRRLSLVPAVFTLGCVAALTACDAPDGPTAPAVPPMAPPTALANQGGAPEPADSPRTLDELGSTICGFPVYVSSVGKLKILDLPGGRMLQIFPANKTTYENGLTGQSITLTLTGTFHFNPLPDGNTEIVLVGRSTVYYDDPPGTLHFSLIVGRYTVVTDPSGGVVRQVSGVGPEQNVCELIS